PASLLNAPRWFCLASSWPNAADPSFHGLPRNHLQIRAKLFRNTCVTPHEGRRAEIRRMHGSLKLHGLTNLQPSMHQASLIGIEWLWRSSRPHGRRSCWVEVTNMNRSASLKIIFAVFAALALFCAPAAFAQRGGGGHGGGGGGGGFHGGGGGGGSFHGSAPSGGARAGGGMYGGARGSANHYSSSPN